MLKEEILKACYVIMYRAALWVLYISAARPILKSVKLCILRKYILISTPSRNMAQKDCRRPIGIKIWGPWPIAEQRFGQNQNWPNPPPTNIPMSMSPHTGHPGHSVNSAHCEFQGTAWDVMMHGRRKNSLKETLKETPFQKNTDNIIEG